MNESGRTKRAARIRELELELSNLQDEASCDDRHRELGENVMGLTEKLRASNASGVSMPLLVGWRNQALYITVTWGPPTDPNVPVNEEGDWDEFVNECPKGLASEANTVTEAKIEKALGISAGTTKCCVGQHVIREGTGYTIVCMEHAPVPRVESFAFGNRDPLANALWQRAIKPANYPSLRYKEALAISDAVKTFSVGAEGEFVPIQDVHEAMKLAFGSDVSINHVENVANALNRRLSRGAGEKDKDVGGVDLSSAVNPPAQTEAPRIGSGAKPDTAPLTSVSQGAISDEELGKRIFGEEPMCTYEVAGRRARALLVKRVKVPKIPENVPTDRIIGWEDSAEAWRAALSAAGVEVEAEDA